MPSLDRMATTSDTVTASLPFRVLVVGGSYAGLAAALNLLDLCQTGSCRFARGAASDAREQPPVQVPVEITIVDERDGYYHLIGSPLALASPNYSAKAWTRFDDIPALQHPNIRWIQGTVVAVDIEKKDATVLLSAKRDRRTESYDFLIAASGLRRVWPVVPQSLSREKYIEETNAHIEAVREARKAVVVIGGGAVGIEMAAELKLIMPHLMVKLIHSRDKLLSSEPLPDEFKETALSLLEERGVEVILRKRVTEQTAINADNEPSLFKLLLDDGTQMFAGHIANAISKSVPSSSYLPAKTLDEEGYVKINSNLYFPDDMPNAPAHFAIGDLARWSGIRRCGSAMAMGHVAAVNAHQQMLQQLFGTAQKLVEFPEVPPMMGLAVGGKAVSYSPVEGVKAGEDIMELMFGDDLGWKICWNYMQLGNTN